MIVIHSVFYFQGEKHFKLNDEKIFITQNKILYTEYHMNFNYPNVAFTDVMINDYLTIIHTGVI
jgi:hypothetical protein